MSDVDPSDRFIKRVVGALTAVLVGSLVAIAYLVDRASRRWWRQADPFLDLRLGIARARASMHRKREGVEDVGRLIAEIVAAR